MIHRITFLLFILAGCLAGATTAIAAAADGPKARMRERVAEIDRLKVGGNVGENNQGFLEVRKAGGGAAEIVAAENKDRAELFRQTAARTGSTSEAVGRSFARQVAGASAPGVWIQAPDGKWQQKR